MEAVQTANTPTPDEIWAILREVGRKQEENVEGMKEIRESHKKHAEDMEEIRQIQKENSRMLGEYSRRFGEVWEHMIAPNLKVKFRELGLDFPSSNSGTYVDDYVNNIHFEVDVKLENGDKAMLVEIKTKLDIDHIKDHMARLEKMRKYADLHGDKRTFMGAVAGVVMSDNVKNYALAQGFFVIEPSGESFYITPPKNVRLSPCKSAYLRIFLRRVMWSFM
jgi:hypothetical protein